MNLRGLAAHLGLSPTTVSLVLNGSPTAKSIPEKTRERVLSAARALDYRPNPFARSLRSKKTSSIGVLLPEISEGYAAGLLSGIDGHLARVGYFFLVASHRNSDDLLQEYVGLLRDRLVEGYIFINTPLEVAPPLPTVVISGHRKLPDVTNVMIDHDRAAVLALEHLKEQGHRDIAFFRGHAKSADTDDRWRAIEAAARALGISVRPELTIQLIGESRGGVFSPEEGYQEGYFFGRRLLDLNIPFTGLFAFNDLSAVGAIRAFFDAGLRVPEDMSVVGFDDIQSAAYQHPRLTTVRQPLKEMGEIAAQTLLKRLAGNGDFPETLTVEPQLIVRESTAMARQASRKTRTLAAP